MGRIGVCRSFLTIAFKPFCCRPAFLKNTYLFDWIEKPLFPRCLPASVADVNMPMEQFAAFAYRRTHQQTPTLSAVQNVNPIHLYLRPLSPFSPTKLDWIQYQLNKITVDLAPLASLVADVSSQGVSWLWRTSSWAKVADCQSRESRPHIIVVTQNNSSNTSQARNKLIKGHLIRRLKSNRPP